MRQSRHYVACMALVRCVAVRWVSDDFPGYVEVQLEDVAHKVWRLTDKAPVFGDDALTSSSEYPCPVWVPCDVVDEPEPGVVDIVLRNGVETQKGEAAFRVPAGSVKVPWHSAAF